MSKPSRPIRIASAHDLGPQFTENPHRMVGQDGAYSIPIGEKTFWYFGDTLIGRRVSNESLWFPGGTQLGPEDMSGKGTIERMLTNTGLLLDDKSGANGLQGFHYLVDEHGDIRQLVPHATGQSRDEIRIWCLHGVQVHDRLYLFHMAVRMLASGPMPVNFELVGSGLASAWIDQWDFELHPATDPSDPATPSIWWQWPLPQFASAVLEGNDGFLYLYGVRKSHDGVQECCLARVRPDEITRQQSYQYWEGPTRGWGDDPARCATIMTGMPNEMSVSWNDYLGCYLAVHSLDLTGAIVARTASQPWGPWSEPLTLWQVEPPQLDYEIPYEPLIYAGKEHPALARDKGRVLYLTYIEFEEYFPHLVEVTLE